MALLGEGEDFEKQERFFVFSKQRTWNAEVQQGTGERCHVYFFFGFG